jgi:quinoprotein glucose dehydrogenase
MKLKTLKIINLFRSFFLTISFIFFFYFNSLAFTLVETPIALDAAWGMTWIDDEQMLITQKSGEVFLVNALDYSQIKIRHDLPFVQYGQGGLLDIISEGNTIWFTGSIEKEKKYTTAIFQATLSGNKLINEKLIYEALPYIKSPYHFGSRIEILDDYLYVSIGERGEGMIAQDTSNSIGSIIRIHKNGDIPDDNPYQNNASWRSELYQIGVRNPQGMSLDPLSQKVFISNHGPKGGDFIGPVIAGSNYGWKQIAWGGKNYSGSKVGDGNAWEPGFLQPEFIWVPSIGVGGIKFYQGNAFPDWQDSLLVGSLKFQYLSVLHRRQNKFVNEEIIFKDSIGRVRDIEINKKGEIFLIADELDSHLYILKP